MIQPQPARVVAVCEKHEYHSPLWREIEALYIYGILLQLASLGGIETRDLATVSERITVDSNLSASELMAQYRKVCRSSRSSYLLSAGLTATDEALNIHYRLFEADAGLYVVDRHVTCPLPTDSTTGSARDIGAIWPIDAMNHLIEATTAHLWKGICGSENALLDETPLNLSYVALKRLLEAHHAASITEKIQLYEAALQEDEHLEAAHIHLARLHRQRQNYPKSITCYHQALKAAHRASARTKSVYATEGGIVCALSGKTDTALQWWNHAITYDPTYLNPYFNLGNTYEDQNDFERAEQAFLEAQKLAPDDFRAIMGLARIYSKLGQWDRALEQYLRQLELEGDDVWCHNDIATCYLNLGKPEQAENHLKETVRLDSDGEAGEYACLILSTLSNTMDSDSPTSLSH